MGSLLYETVIGTGASQKDEGNDNEEDFGSSIASIVSLVIDCPDKQLITDKEKKVLFNRAYQVIIKTPGR